MGKRGRKTSYETFEKDLMKIEENFLKNVEAIQKNFKRPFSVNKSLQSSVYATSKESFDFQVNIARQMLKHYKKTKSRSYEAKLRDFSKTFKPLSQKRTKQVVKKFTIVSRDQFISLFRKMDKDEDIIKFLENEGLWDDQAFWESFFNSPYYTPLYKEYTKENTSNFWDNAGGGAITGHSFWGDELLTFALYYMETRGLAITSEVPKHYDFNYYASRKK